MRRSVALASLLAGVALLAPATASGAAKVGVADNSPAIFQDPLYTQLGSKITRKIIPIDTIEKGGPALADLDKYMLLARASRVEVMIAFNPTAGHKFNTTRDLPTPAKYRRYFKQYLKRYPWQRVYQSWNEINHFSQPTYKNPRRAAQFTNEAVKACRKCKITAGDFLDQKGLASYFKRFKRALKVKPKYWGLHNYSDTNRFRSKGTREFLRLTRRGEVWLSETGGVVQLCPRRCSFAYNEKRAAKAIRYMFTLARSNKRIKRLYTYSFYGVPRTERFDAGIVGPGGNKRPGYNEIAKRLK